MTFFYNIDTRVENFISLPLFKDRDLKWPTDLNAQISDTN